MPIRGQAKKVWASANAMLLQPEHSARQQHVSSQPRCLCDCLITLCICGICYKRSWQESHTGLPHFFQAWLQVRYLQAKNARLQEKVAMAERSAAASMAQKVCPSIVTSARKLMM